MLAERWRAGGGQLRSGQAVRLDAHRLQGTERGVSACDRGIWLGVRTGSPASAVWTGPGQARGVPPSWGRMGGSDSHGRQNPP